LDCALNPTILLPVKRAIQRGGRRARGGIGRALLGLVLCLAAAACRPRADAPGGNPHPPRLVSLSPSLTEIVATVGGPENLAGRSSACRYPPAVVARVPVVGDFGVPSLEAIAAAQPDAVISVDMADQSLAAAIRQLGIPYETIPCLTLDDVAPAIRRVGALVRREGRADALAAAIEQGLAARRANRPTAPPVPVYLEVWSDPLMTVGARSFINEMVQLAGGTNVAGAIDADYPRMSEEAVLAWDPAVILLLHTHDRQTAARQVAARPGWSIIAAVRNGRVTAVPDPDLLQQPGPRLLEGLDALEACLATETAP
jgi:iron complex transport system substrate-binding protein